MKAGTPPMGLAVDQLVRTRPSERSPSRVDEAKLDDLIETVYATEHSKDKKRPKANPASSRDEADDGVNVQQGQRSAGTMLDAVLNGDLDETYETIVDDTLTDCDAHTRDPEGRTTVHLAAYEGHLDILMLLLGKEVKVDGHGKVSIPPEKAMQQKDLVVEDIYGNTPLLQSAKIMHPISRDDDGVKEDIEVMKLLLNAEAGGGTESINKCQPSTGMSPLHWIAYHGDLELLAVLLEPQWQAKLDIRDMHGRTAMDLAGIRALEQQETRHRIEAIPEALRSGRENDILLRDHEKACIMLLEVEMATPKAAEADTDAEQEARQAYLQHVLLWASIFNHTVTVDALLAAKHDPLAVVITGKSFVPHALGLGSCTALHAAAACGNTEILKKLLSCAQKLRGADGLDSAESWYLVPSKVTPVHLAARMGHHGCIEALLQHKPHVNASLTSENGWKPRELCQNSPARVALFDKHRASPPAEMNIEYVMVFNKKNQYYLDIMKSLLQYPRRNAPELTVEAVPAHYYNEWASGQAWTDQAGLTEETMLLISITDQNLGLHAEAMRLPVRLQHNNEVSPFVFDRTDEFEPLQSMERQLIVRDVIENKFDVDRYLADGFINHLFPLHSQQGIALVSRMWYYDDRSSSSIWPPLSNGMFREMLTEGPTNIASEVSSLKQYYGAQTATYFAWISYVTVWLLIPLPCGILLGGLQAYTQDFEIKASIEAEGKSYNFHGSVLYTVIAAIWCTVMIERWKRKLSEITHLWDRDDRDEDDQDDEERTRPEFRGEDRLIYESGKVEKQYPSMWDCRQKALTLVPVVVICGGVLVCAVLFEYLKTEYAKDNIIWQTGFAMGYGCIVAATNELFSRRMAFVLNDYENHPTEVSYNSALITKVFLFQFANCFFTPFYLAYFKRDFTNLSIQLFFLQFAQTGADIVSWLLVPRYLFMLKLKLFKMYDRVQEEEQQSKIQLTQAPTSDSRVCPAVEEDPLAQKTWQAEKEKCMPPPLDLVELMASKVVQLGYVMLFAAACPLAPLVAFLLNTVQLRAIIQYTSSYQQRPPAFDKATLGVWGTIVEFMSFFAVANNVCLLYFTSSGLRNDYGDVNTLWFLVIAEHILILLKGFLAVMIEDSPAHVRMARARNRRTQVEILERAETMELAGKRDLVHTTEDAKAPTLPLAVGRKSWMKQVKGNMKLKMVANKSRAPSIDLRR